MSWGLVLSGGAAYGVANVGVVECLEKEGLSPDVIAGSSMGAVVAGLYALGIETKTIREIGKQLTPSTIVSWKKRPLSDGLEGGVLEHRMKEILAPYIQGARIADCRIPFVCVAGRILKTIPWKNVMKQDFLPTLLKSVETYVFPPETLILDALSASCAVPVVFQPVKVGKSRFIDLCTFGAVPVQSLKKHHTVDCIIATDTTPTYTSVAPYLPQVLRKILYASQEFLHTSTSACDIVIVPKLDGAPYHFQKSMEFMDAGKEATEERMEDILRILQKEHAKAA